NGSALVSLLPRDQFGNTLGALQISMLINDVSSSVRFFSTASSCDCSLTSSRFRSLTSRRAVEDFPTALPEAVSAWSAALLARSAVLAASPALVDALEALVNASFALVSRDPIICSDRVSFLCPYGYAAISANTA